MGELFASRREKSCWENALAAIHRAGESECLGCLGRPNVIFRLGSRALLDGQWTANRVPATPPLHRLYAHFAGVAQPPDLDAASVELRLRPDRRCVDIGHAIRRHVVERGPHPVCSSGGNDRPRYFVRDRLERFSERALAGHIHELWTILVALPIFVASNRWIWVTVTSFTAYGEFPWISVYAPLLTIIVLALAFSLTQSRKQGVRMDLVSTLDRDTRRALRSGHFNGIYVSALPGNPERWHWLVRTNGPNYTRAGRTHAPVACDGSSRGSALGRTYVGVRGSCGYGRNLPGGHWHSHQRIPAGPLYRCTTPSLFPHRDSNSSGRASRAPARRRIRAVRGDAGRGLRRLAGYAPAGSAWPDG